MNRTSSFVVPVVVALAALTPRLATAQDLLAPSRWSAPTTTTFVNGSADDDLAVRPAADEVPAVGPRALAVSGGSLVILDNENERLVQLARAPAPAGATRAARGVRATHLPGARYMADLVGIDAAVVTFDARLNEIVHIDLSTGEIGRQRLPTRRFEGLVPLVDGVRVRGAPGTGVGGTDRELRWRRAPSGAITPRPPTRAETDEDTPGLGARAEMTVVNGTPVGLLYALTAASDTAVAPVEVSAPIAGTLVSVTPMARDRGRRLFVRLEVLDESTGALRVRRFIRVFGADGLALDTFEYPTDGIVIPDRDVAVDDDGNVHILLPTTEGTRLWRLAAP